MYQQSPCGILLINKPANKTSFSLVAVLRRLLKVKKIGHAGTLDPFATGVMVLLIGKEFTTLSDQFLCSDKEYIATLRLGIETDSYDCDGKIVNNTDIIPSFEMITESLKDFQGNIKQIPPMFSAKKLGGKKLYELARKGVVIERQPVEIAIQTQLIRYEYPFLELRISCSKGTYIRSIAQDLGKKLGCGAHLSALQRVRSGNFHIDDCIDGSLLFNSQSDIKLIESSLIQTIDMPRKTHENCL